MNSNELIRKLIKLGAQMDASHGKGGHAKVTLNGKITFVPRHGKQEIPTGTLRSICRQLEINFEEL